MKYTSEQINKMSWQEWNETMAEELNRKGFKAKEFNSDEHRWTKTGKYVAGDDQNYLCLVRLRIARLFLTLKILGCLTMADALCVAALFIVILEDLPADMILTFISRFVKTA